MPTLAADNLARRQDARATLAAMVTYAGDLTNAERAALNAALDVLDRPDPNGPLSDEQRKALFAATERVFGARRSDLRYAFTRIVLDKPADATVSWAQFKPGRLTYGEASKVLDALAQLEAAL